MLKTKQNDSSAPLTKMLDQNEATNFDQLTLLLCVQIVYQMISHIVGACDGVSAKQYLVLVEIFDHILYGQIMYLIVMYLKDIFLVPQVNE